MVDNEPVFTLRPEAPKEEPVKKPRNWAGTLRWTGEVLGVLAIIAGIALISPAIALITLGAYLAFISNT